MPTYSSSEDEGPPWAGPHPGSSGEYSAADEFVAPRWVQRVYGPPPPAYAMPTPELAAVWAAAPVLPAPGGAYVFHPAAPAAPAGGPTFNVQAYTPGAAVMRARSPSTSTGLHAGGASGEDYVVPPRPQPFDASPAKGQLFGGPAPSEGDVEAGAGPVPRPAPGGFDNLTMPSKSVAMRERRNKQLRTFDKDSFGVPLPATRRPFSLFASPFAVAEVCTGLGVYLASVQAAVILAALLALVCVYPLVDNVKNQRWAQEYSLITGAGAAVASCPKGWDLTSWLTPTTIGGHCSGKYTSRYDCAAQCVWDPERLAAAQCRGVKPPGLETPAAANATAAATAQRYTLRLSGQCAQHMPCVAARADPTAPDGPCLCCQLQQDPATIAANPRVSAGQLWTFFIGQLVFLVWLLFLMHTQLKAAHVQGTRVVGASDYSAWISGITKTRAEDGPLAHWCGQFGPVVAAFNVPSVGDALRVGRRVAGLQVSKAESDALQGSTSCSPLHWAYRRFVVGRPQALADALDRQQRKLAIYERQEAEPTGQGLVTFEFSESAAAAIAAFDRPPLRALLDAASLRLTDTTPRLHGAVVSVQRAPEPSDILWEHTNCTGRAAFARRAWSFAATALIILAGAGIQYGLAVAAEALREQRLEAQYAAGTGVASAVEEAAKKTTKLRAVAVVSATVVVTINLAIMLTVRALSWYERWTTRTSMERWVMLKLSVSQLCNAFAAPMLAAYVAGNRSGWFARGGLAEAAFYVQCANALVPPLFHLLGLGDWLKMHLLAPHARTQAMLNTLLAPPPFPMAEQYAASVTTLGLALWYMPILPTSPMIALVGLSVSYCANKWVALRRAAAPPNLSGMVTAPLNWLLRLLPLIQLILMRHLYFDDYPAMTPVFWTGLAFWTLFCLAPIRALLGAVRRRRRAHASAGMSYHRLLGGKRLGVGDVYAPVVPKPCSRKFKERVAATFAQLAPAAFETILNGEEIAKFLFGGGGGGGGAAAKAAALGITESEFAEFGGGAGAAGKAQMGSVGAGPPPGAARASLRASLTAGVHGTLALLWQPQDADHPQDVYLPAADAMRASAGGSDEEGAAPPPSAPPAPRAAGVYATPRPVSASASDSCNPGDTASGSDGGGCGGGGGGGTPAGATGRGPGPSTATPGSSAFIPAVRHRGSSATPPARPVPPRVPSTAGRTPAQPSRLGPRRASQPPGANAMDNFRPLGSGLSQFFGGE